MLHIARSGFGPCEVRGGMRHRLHKSINSILPGMAVLLLATSSMVAQTASINLLDPGSGANLAGIYTSPYDGSINGGASVHIICDDFADETYISESWTANVTSLSSLSQTSWTII